MFTTQEHKICVQEAESSTQPARKLPTAALHWSLLRKIKRGNSLAPILFYDLSRLDLIQHYKAINCTITFLIPYLPSFLYYVICYTPKDVQPSSYSGGSGWNLQSEYSGRSIKVTPSLHLVPRLSMGGAIHPIIHAPSWRGV